jgi:ATP adenylyltransferase
LFEMPPGEVHKFISDVTLLSRTLQELFAPDKINYAIYGDVLCHVHFNIVPKYAASPGWGGAFINVPENKLRLSEAEQRERAGLIREALLKNKALKRDQNR